MYTSLGSPLENLANSHSLPSNSYTDLWCCCSSFALVLSLLIGRAYSGRNQVILGVGGDGWVCYKNAAVQTSFSF